MNTGNFVFSEIKATACQTDKKGNKKHETTVYTQWFTVFPGISVSKYGTQKKIPKISKSRM